MRKSILAVCLLAVLVFCLLSGAVFAENAFAQVALLAKNAASLDVDESNIQQFLDGNFPGYSILDAGMIKNGEVDLANYDVLYMRPGSEPMEYNDPDIISKIQTRIESGGKLILEYNGVFLAGYLGMGTIGTACWDPVTYDAAYYVEKATDSNLLDNLTAWSPPNLPNRSDQLISQLTQPGFYCYPLFNFNVGPEVIRYVYLYTTYGWPFQPIDSAYCLQNSGVCAPERSVWDYTNDGWFADHGVNYRFIEVATLGNGQVYRLGLNMMQAVSASNLIIGPVANQIRVNTINAASGNSLPCSYTYSNWEDCQTDGTQTRSVLSSLPTGCVGTPVTSQTCTYVTPVIISFSNFQPQQGSVIQQSVNVVDLISLKGVVGALGNTTSLDNLSLIQKDLAMTNLRPILQIVDICSTGSAIDWDSVSMSINGIDVTSQIGIFPRLPLPGCISSGGVGIEKYYFNEDVEIEITVKTMDGTQKTVKWEFAVQTDYLYPTSKGVALDTMIRRFGGIVSTVVGAIKALVLPLPVISY